MASSGSSLYLAAKDNRGCIETDITIKVTSRVTPLVSVYLVSENTLKIKCKQFNCNGKKILIIISNCNGNKNLISQFRRQDSNELVITKCNK